LFADCVEVGWRLLKAWTLDVESVGEWSQQSQGTPLGSPDIVGESLVFENGDSLDGIDPSSFDLSVSGYLVLKRFLEARAHLAMTVDLGVQIQHVMAAIAEILDCQQVCDSLLARAIESPQVAFGES
jgi:hypothetical protein